MLSTHMPDSPTVKALVRLVLVILSVQILALDVWAAEGPHQGANYTHGFPLMMPDVRLHEVQGSESRLCGVIGMEASAEAHPVAADAEDGSLVSYTAFDGREYDLRQFLGRYTVVLLMEADLDRYSVAYVRRIVDYADVIYSHVREVTGGEPRGDGLLKIAYIDLPYGGPGGYGRLGWKRTEITNRLLEPGRWETNIRAICHEMIHNFDLYSPYIMYGSDPAHSWTGFLELYMFAYMRSNFFNIAPDVIPWYKIGHVLLPYLRHPESSWEKCVLEDSCVPESSMSVSTQSGLVWQFAQFYGTQAVTDWLSRLREEMGDWPFLNPSPDSARERNDLLIETMSAAVEDNLGCFIDSLNWSVSDELRVRMATLYGTCRDDDDDGWAIGQGDCDDAEPTVNPAADEQINDRDDNCNGVLDDVLFPETQDFPDSLAASVELPFPARVTGEITSSQDWDYIGFRVQKPTELWVRMDSPQNLNVATSWYSEGSWVGGGGTEAGHATNHGFPAPSGTSHIAVGPNSAIGTTPGPYNFIIWALDAPPAPQGRSPVHDAPREYQFLVPTVAGKTFQQGDVIRYWVFKHGWVGEMVVGATEGETYRWTVPCGTMPGDYWYRVQVYRDNRPWTPISEPVEFAIQDSPCLVSGGVLNAASFEGAPVAPGQIVSIFGSGLGPAEGANARLDAEGLLSRRIGGTEVLFDGLPAPLFYVRQDQINAQVPYEIAGKREVQVQVRVEGEISNTTSVPVSATAPGIFTYSDGTERAVALNQDGSLNSPSNTARTGEIIVMFATGEGQTVPAGVTGELSSDLDRQPLEPVGLSVCGQPAVLHYAAPAPGFAGLMQINAQVPATAHGKCHVILNAGSLDSQAGVTISVDE